MDWTIKYMGHVVCGKLNENLRVALDKPFIGNTIFINHL